jgi:hypothetical protein
VNVPDDEMIDLFDTPRPLSRHEIATRLEDALVRHEQMMRAKVAEEMSAPFAMTNADISELCAPCIRSDCCGCGEVYQRYFLRIARGGSDAR